MTGTTAGADQPGHGRAATLAAVARDARLTRGYVMQIALASAIATLGLLMDSSPVIIGAMLISPLLGPIMGFGFALAIFDGRLLRRSLQTLGTGAVIGVVVAVAIVAVSPITDPTPSLLARIRPSLLDLFVAIFGGLAGAYALLKRNAIGIVGVAIATALVPPLATVGWGLATGRTDAAAGALLMFVTNSAAIGFMATAVARYNAFGANLSPKQTRLQAFGILAVLGLLAVPLWVSLSAVLHEARTAAALRQDLTALAGAGATIERLDIVIDEARPSVSAVVIGPAFVTDLEKRFAVGVRRELGPGASTQVLQLRSGSAEAEIARNEAAQAERARQALAGEAQRLRSALALAYGVEADTIVIDPERYRALIVRPADAAAPASSAVAALRAAFPDWTVQIMTAAALSSPVPVDDAAPAQDTAVTAPAG